MRIVPENTPVVVRAVFFFSVLILVAFLGVMFRNAWRESRTEKPLRSGEPTVVIRQPVAPSQLPIGWSVTRPPSQTIVTPIAWPTQVNEQGERVVYIRDTIRVPVPEAIARDSAIRITSDKPVTVHRPLIGDPSVSVATYNPRSQAYETLRYHVPEHPVKYGAALDAYYAANVLALDSIGASYIGAGIEAYVGYRNFLPFVRVDLDSENGVTGRAGLRYRVGR